MLWPLVLPFEITCWTLIALLVVATVAAPVFRTKRKRVFAWGFFVALIAFIPSCTAVMSLVDEYRFGIFNYPDFRSVNDFRVERYLPEPATDITIEKHPQGFRAKFEIGKPALDDWFDRTWEQNGEHSVVPRVSDREAKPVRRETFEHHFGDLGWEAPSDLNEYEGPVAGNGAGFTIWYNERASIGYEHAGYW